MLPATRIKSKSESISLVGSIQFSNIKYTF